MHLPLMYFCARYYDTSTGEFTSRDPLQYVDGMTMYRGYFALGSVDPFGRNKRPGLIGPADESPSEGNAPMQGCVVDTRPRKCVVKSGPTYYDFLEPGWTDPDWKMIRIASFKFKAEFDDVDGRCECCAVRQYIKWDTDYDEFISGAPFWPQDSFGVDEVPGWPTKANTWYEDRLRRPPYYRYGHHDGKWSGLGDSDYYTNQGCSYFGQDDPTAPGNIDGNRVFGKWHFRVVIIDLCDGGKEVQGASDELTIDWSEGTFVVPPVMSGF